MPHQLEIRYGLTAQELLDAIDSRFRLRVAVEGRVAEVHLQKQLESLKTRGVLTQYEEHDRNGYPDFTVWRAKTHRALLIECKSIRKAVYMVEVQKTRAAKGDPSSRQYDVGYFDILAVCLGKQTGQWDQFLFVKSEDLELHEVYPNKLKVMHRVPLTNSRNISPWFTKLEDLLVTL